MNFNNEEEVIIRAFTRLMQETSLIYNIIFEKRNSGLGTVCIFKEDDKWIFYIVDHNTIFEYKEYDNLYRLCIEFFYTLEKKNTDYCLKMFPSYINEEMGYKRVR